MQVPRHCLVNHGCRLVRTPCTPKLGGLLDYSNLSHLLIPRSQCPLSMYMPCVQTHAILFAQGSAEKAATMDSTPQVSQRACRQGIMPSTMLLLPITNLHFLHGSLSLLRGHCSTVTVRASHAKSYPQPRCLVLVVSPATVIVGR